MRIAISIRGQPQLLFIEVGESVEIGDAELTTVPIPNSFVTHYGVQFPKTKLLWNSPRVLSELYLEHFGLVFVDDGVDA